MIVLDVYFNNNLDLDGQALLEENLITNTYKLHLKNTLFAHEVQHFINRAVEILKPTYGDVKTEIHWNETYKESDLNINFDNEIRKVEENERN